MSSKMQTARLDADADAEVGESEEMRRPETLDAIFGRDESQDEAVMVEYKDPRCSVDHTIT